MKIPKLSFILYALFILPGVAVAADIPTLTPTATPSLPPIPGQAELLQGQEILKTEATPVPRLPNDGFEEKKAEARKWFEKAKSMGNAEAELDLYLLYDRRYRLGSFNYPQLPYLAEQLAQQTIPTFGNCQELFARVLGLVRRSAEQGNAYAAFQMAQVYLRDNQDCGLKADSGEGFKWMKLAAERGYADAEFAMGDFYQNAWKIYPSMKLPPDPEVARVWFEKSAAQGNKTAQDMLARLDSENAPVTFVGLLDGMPLKTAVGGQLLTLDEPVTWGGFARSTVSVNPFQKTRRFKDYVRIEGNLHWVEMAPTVKINRMTTLEDHGSHLLKSLTRGEYTPDQVSLKFKADTPEAVQKKILAKVGEVQKEFSWGGVFIKTKKGMSVPKALKLLINEPSIEFAEPNHIYHIDFGMKKKGTI